MSKTQDIRKLIGDNQIEKAFIRLRQVTSTDEDLNDAVLILKSQWEELSKNKLTGVLAPGEERQIHAKIASGMLDLCRLLDGNNLKINKDLPPNKMPERTTHPSGIYIWIGFGLFLVILIILLVIPCPTPPQFFAFRLGLALSAGLIGSIIPGLLLNLNLQTAKAGSATVLALLVYLVNPAVIVKSDICDKLPFEFTASLQQASHLSVTSTYPRLEEASLMIRLTNKWEEVEIDGQGDADFKNIPGDYKNLKVAARLKAKYWKLVNDSIVLKDKSQALFIAPDESLSKISGKVMDAHSGNPIAGATIETLGIVAHSNETGNFEIVIPLEKQRIDYEVYAQKKGYTAAKGNATPATGVSMSILLPR